MPSPSVRLSLAIGISKAPPLPFLRGALNGAQEFHAWAQSAGYQSELLTDGGGATPITIDIVRDKLVAMLSTAPGNIFRFILYFAGHGLIREAEEGLWLLSDWNNTMRAVAVEGLKRRLYMYGIQQISIFADACRSLPTDMNAADLVADAVLGRGPIKPTTTPYIDKFIAAQDGATTFAVPGPIPDKDRCLFSGVLMEGLWGQSPSAISTFFPGKVTSQSLGQYLLAEVPKRAQVYKRTLNPTVQPLFPLGSDIYFGDLVPPPTPPAFSPWPSASEVLGLGPAPALLTIPAPSISIGAGLGEIASAFAGSATKFASAVAPNFTLNLDAILAAPAEVAPEPPAPPPPPPDPGEVLQARIQEQEIPTHFETGAGLALTGAEIAAVWLPGGFSTSTGGRPDWWHVGSQTKNYLDRPTQALIELMDSRYVAINLLPQFIVSCVCEERGAQALVYRELFAAADTGDLATTALCEMESGSLRADAVTTLAVQLRELKHVDPTLGLISAYLYDSIGDVDSIRRMACFYAQRGQAIPYDIALLAQIECHWDASSGKFTAFVSEVPVRAPRTKQESEHPWTYQATAGISGVVAGFWPWMRQGWAFLDDPLDAESGLIAPGLPEMSASLTSARFTTFSSEGGKKLALMFNMVPWPR